MQCNFFSRDSHKTCSRLSYESSVASLTLHCSSLDTVVCVASIVIFLVNLWFLTDCYEISTCIPRIPSVTCACSFSTIVLPHTKNGWAMQNFWNTFHNIIIRMLFNILFLLLFLEQPVYHNPSPLVVKIKEDSFSWISEVQNCLEKLREDDKLKLVLYSEDEKFNGILGLTISLIKEVGVNKIR